MAQRRSKEKIQLSRIKRKDVAGGGNIETEERDRKGKKIVH